MVSIVRAAFRPTAQAAATLTSSVRHQSSQAAHCVTIINGVGEIGTQIAMEAMKRGHTVIGCGRNLEALSHLASKGFTVVHAPEEAARTPKFWTTLFEKYATGPRVKFIQAVGVGYADTLEDLKKINIDYTAASAKAFKALEVKYPIKEVIYVQLSTLATQVVPDTAYASTKEEANRVLIKEDIKRTLVIDIGYALPSIENGEDFAAVNNRHSYSPMQFAALPWPIRVHPVLGSGMQLLQPIDERDLAKAILNFEKGQVRIAGVGRQVITQKDFMRFFAELAGHSFHPMSIPLEIVELAEHFPEGYFNPENAQALKKLEKEPHLFDPEPFEELLGKRSSTLNEIYPSNGKPIIYTRPPIGAHLWRIVKTLATSAEARADTLKVVKKHGFTLAKNFLTC